MLREHLKKKEQGSDQERAQLTRANHNDTNTWKSIKHSPRRSSSTSLTSNRPYMEDSNDREPKKDEDCAAWIDNNNYINERINKTWTKRERSTGHDKRPTK